MEIRLDHYSRRARALPVYLTVAPAALVLVAVLPDGFKVPLGGAAAIVFVPLAFLAAQFGADFGKRLERRLWREWGGPPTTRFLRHANGEYNEVTRGRIHDRLRGMGLHVPTALEQQQDPAAADRHFESCTEELIRRTRDGSQFALVFKGLTEYGFRRNLLGLKPFGLPITIVCLIGCGWGVASAWDGSRLPAAPIVAAVLTAGLLLCWLTWVNKHTVRISADRYARFLLEASLDLK